MWIAVAAALLAQDHHPGPAPSAARGELRVYLLDRDKKPLDLDGVTATLEIAFLWEPRRDVKMQAASGKRADTGGELRELDGGGIAEIVVVTSDDCCEGDPVPYFKTEIPLELHHCGVPDHALEEKPGACGMCRQEMRKREVEFTATIRLMIRGERKELGAFEYPPVPRTFAAGVAAIEAHVKDLGEGNFEDLPKIGAKISRIADRLPRLTPKDDLPEVLKACLELTGLGPDLAAAARSKNKGDVERIVVRYQERSTLLKRHVRE